MTFSLLMGPDLHYGSIRIRFFLRGQMHWWNHPLVPLFIQAERLQHQLLLGPFLRLSIPPLRSSCIVDR